MSVTARAGALLTLMAGSLFCASCGARTAPLVSADAGADAAEVVRDAGAPPCTIRCDARPIAPVPLFSNWVDVVRTDAGWLVVQGDEGDQTMLRVVTVSDGVVRDDQLSLPMRVREPRIAWDPTSAVGIVVFNEGALWVDARGRPLSDPIWTAGDEMSRGGRPVTVAASFLIWTGDHSAASMDAGLEAAIVRPLAGTIAWEGILEAPARAGSTPDFERHTSGFVGVWRTFRGRELLVSWMDGAASRERTYLFEEPVPHTTGTVDRYNADFAIVRNRVAVLRGTTRMHDDGRRERVVTLDVIDRDGRFEANVFDTRIDPDSGPCFLETFDQTSVAVYREGDATFVLPLLGRCADRGASRELAPGHPRFFDAMEDNSAVLVTAESEDRGVLYEVRCGGE